jgi:hypothetical protein
MGATGVYWKGASAILKDAFECMLVNAGHVKQVTLAIGQEQAFRGDVPRSRMDDAEERPSRAS